MASVDPEQVFKIIRSIPETTNFRVLEDITDAACILPAKIAKQLVSRMKRWANVPYLGLLPEKLGTFIAHLIQGGHIQEAYTLAAAFLTPLAQSIMSSDTWLYEQLLQKHLSVLLVENEQLVVKLLCRLLDTVLASSYQGTEGLQDFSYIWRPAIENGVRQSLHELKDVLVSAVRDVAERIVKENKATLQAMISLLEKHSWPVFHRVALYLLYVFGNQAPELVIKQLTNQQIFGALYFHHEYVRLAQKYFANLPVINQETILNWGRNLPYLLSVNNKQENLSLCKTCRDGDGNTSRVLAKSSQRN